MFSGSASPANDTSPMSPLDTPSGTGVASRGINIGGLASGLGGFLERKDSAPNVKLGSSRDASPSPELPALPPRNVRSAIWGAGVHEPGLRRRSKGKRKRC